MRMIEHLVEKWVDPDYREQLGYSDRMGELAEKILAGTATHDEEVEALDTVDEILTAQLEGE